MLHPFSYVWSSKINFEIIQKEAKIFPEFNLEFGMLPLSI
ncbi:hypothetical protein LEP1GSC196_1532 [Leptospira meyeri serovar Semaranga str. Veldrot Semarang 173]|nr:hypothetical protein LEP1GSC196_1532 [Leptospira meyeri serovar Semaranga str. Veldrot Semarang 173]